jgi:hypothetical protein
MAHRLTQDSGGAEDKALMVAFHFPPYQGSSGVLRTWNFSRYLPDYGWSPLLLTAREAAYGPLPSGSGGLVVPGSLKVWRAPALDAARDLAVFGRYLRLSALPDRWVSWCVPAILRGLTIAREYAPRVLWSTFPIPSAHLVGLALHRLTRLPWVADFRDSMTEPGYPANRWEHSSYRWIERRVIHSANAVVFTTESTRRLYAERYGAAATRKFHVIQNGYSEESFQSAESVVGSVRASAGKQQLRLTHSGILYPNERDPRPFLEAISNLKSGGQISARDLQIIFRASGHDATIKAMIDAACVDDIVTLAPPVSYEAALAEMLAADGLLLFQAKNCNHQIPAKVYEYLRAARPLLALTDYGGDTAKLLRSSGIQTIGDISNSEDIAVKLVDFLRHVRAGSAPIADRSTVQKFSRSSQTRELAELFRAIVGESIDA